MTTETAVEIAEELERGKVDARDYAERYGWYVTAAFYTEADVEKAETESAKAYVRGWMETAAKRK